MRVHRTRLFLALGAAVLFVLYVNTIRVSAGEDKLILNPGFEKKGPDDIGIAHWFNTNPDKTLHYDLDEKIKHSGKRSLKMWAEGENRNPNVTIHHLYDPKKWKGETFLSVAGYVRAEKALEAAHG